MIFAARLAVTVDVEFDATDIYTAASDADVIGLALRSLIDGSVLPGPGTPVVWVSGIDIVDVLGAAERLRAGVDGDQLVAPATRSPDTERATAPMTTIDLDTLHLEKGAHRSPDDGACIMEAVALLAGERWSDTPACASPVLGAFLRTWNDTLDDDDRQSLKQYIPRLVGSAGTRDQEDARAWMALDWLVRVQTPAWLRLVGLAEHADRLAGLAEFRAGMDVPSIRPAIDAARKDARAAWAAARDAARAATWAAAGDATWAAAGDATWAAAGAAARAAARDATWAAAGDAAWAAAGDAARDATWDAARAAAGDAARDATWAAAGDATRAAAGAAARAAARDAAWAAARAAAWAAAWAAARAAAWAAAGDAARAAAGDAARAAAGDALAPTVTELQGAAHHLVAKMLEVTES